LSSGCAVAGLDWWNQDEVKRYDMWKKFYPAILKFTENIDFENDFYWLQRFRQERHNEGSEFMEKSLHFSSHQYT